MPKPHTFPTLFDEVKTISISFLSKHGYLKPKQIQSGILKWSRGNIETGSISIVVNTFDLSPFIELKYSYNGSPVNYRVQLVSAPSNIGKGFVWYFVCPHTQKRCRKLYSVQTYFYHRSAFSGCMYDKQTLSKRNRTLLQIYSAYFKKEELYKERYKKYFKTHYAGKPTKRYLKLSQLISIAESFSNSQIEMLMTI